MAHPQEEPNENGCSFVLATIAIIILITTIVILASCRTTHTDYKELYTNQSFVISTLRDSISSYRTRIENLQSAITISKQDLQKQKEKDSIVLNQYIYRRDSTATSKRGDTIFIDRWHWDYTKEEKLSERLRVDSISHIQEVNQLRERILVLQDSIHKIQQSNSIQKDSVSHTVQEKEVVERQPSFWQQLKSEMGEVILFLITIAFILYILKKQKGGDL